MGIRMPVCVWVLVLISEYSFVVCLGSFVLFSLLLCLDSRAHWFWASAWCWETHTREYITCFPSPPTPTPTPTPTPADSPFAWLCLCASVCEFMHTNWKISDLWFVPAKRSVANKQQNNNNKSSTSHAKAGYRAETPEQTPSRARADPETDANATASTQSTHHSQLPSQSTPLAATSQRQTNQKARHSGTMLR